MPNQPSPVLAAAATTSDYVLPAPPRGNGEIVVVAPANDSAPALRRGGEVARVLGDRFLALTESQQLFFAELRERMGTLDASVAEASRAQIKGAVKELVGVLDWCDAVQRDLVYESRCAASGQEPLDLVVLAEDVAARLGLDRAVLVSGQAGARWWGEAAVAADLIRAGIELLAERAPGSSAIAVDVQLAGGRIRLRFATVGEPGDSIEPATIRRFRAAVEHLGAAVLPDELGMGGAACLVELPW